MKRKEERLIGYTGEPCPNCGRYRMQSWNCGKRINEKYHCYEELEEDEN